MLQFLKNNRYERHMKKPNKFYRNPISEECYNLDYSFIQFITPRLQMFRKEASKTIDYDFTILDTIINGFILYYSVFDWDVENIDNNNKIVKNSMKLFAEHWTEFWW
jgi:hypothetical protein